MSKIKRILKVLFLARISISITALMAIVLLKVPQAQDAIIALGNFANIFQYLFFSFIGLLWALSNWYWPRTFYYMEYHKEEGLEPFEIRTIKYTPRVIGALAILLIGIVTLKESGNIPVGDSGRNPLTIIGILFLVLTGIFLFFVFFRRKLFNMNSIGDTTSPLNEVNGMVPFQNLPGVTKQVLLISTGISILLLLLITIWPIQITGFLGDGATVLLTTFTIWIPLLYWVQYLGLRFRIPSFVFLIIIITLFSNINSNSNVTIINGERPERETVIDHYKTHFLGKDKPLIFILSEGGGIRAAYWSSNLLSRLDKENNNFRSSIFAINGVSGGAFGSTVYLSLLNSSNGDNSELQNMAKRVVGKDYLSPVIGAMLTRGLLQYLIPVPIPQFDHAKVFEESWEYHWKKETGNTDFSNPVDDLWSSDIILPPLFINSTRVEDGNPFVISSLSMESSIIQDLYRYIDDDEGFKISTASLLSARFPYVGPAGIIEYNKIVESDDGIRETIERDSMGLVDGGYFDNTGANTTFEILMELYESGEFNYEENRPVVIYLKNGSDTEETSLSTESLLYQILAPLNTTMQLRDANTLTGLKRVHDLVTFLEGELYILSLEREKEYNAEIPLGWALSAITQSEIDNRIEFIINKDDEYKTMKDYLNNFTGE